MISEHESELEQIFKNQPVVCLKCNVYHKDILTLKEGQWLNSEAVHFLLSLVQSNTQSSIKCLDPFISSMIIFMGEDVILETMREQNLFSYEYLLIPSNTETKNVGKGSHWFLMCYCEKEKKIYEFDSSYECIHTNAIKMKERLERMYFLFEGKQVEIKIERSQNVIKQNNDYDCGIFVVGHAEQIISSLSTSPNVAVNAIPILKDFFQNLRVRYYGMAINKLKQTVNI